MFFHGAAHIPPGGLGGWPWLGHGLPKTLKNQWETLVFSMWGTHVPGRGWGMVRPRVAGNLEKPLGFLVFLDEPWPRPNWRWGVGEYRKM